MIVGIDLGTTNSLIGAFIDGNTTLFPNVSGQMLTPSAVSIDNDGDVIVGVAAKDRLITHPDRSAANFKRWMGTDREVELIGHRLRAEQLSTLVLKSLLEDAKSATGEAITEAVISVPAYFSDAQRQATRIAGEMAGVKVDRLINEPTAAALAYGLQDRKREGRFLVFDLGGGTLDVSILEMFDGVVEVHATAGDNYLGGEDFTSLLIDAALKDFDIDLDEVSVTDRARLRRKMDRFKISLSNQGRAQSQFEIGGRSHPWDVDDHRFSEIVHPLVQRMQIPLTRALHDARTDKDALDEIVLVGDASRMPLVARMISRNFGRLPLRHVNPDEAIGRGVAIAAGLKARNVSLSEIILTDVCPYTLGIDTARRDKLGQLQTDHYLPIINRGTVVPVSLEETIVPVHPAQTKILCKIFQGESPIASKNIQIGMVEIPVPASHDDRARAVSVRFTYDINGILQVELAAVETGEKRELVIEQNPGRLTEDQVRQRLESLSGLKIHPRERLENTIILARLEKCYEEYIDLRDHIQSLLLEFRAVLERQEKHDIDTLRDTIKDYLDKIEF